MESIGIWFEARPALIGWLIGLSTITFLGSLIVIPVMVLRIPADYFLARGKSESRSVCPYPASSLPLLIFKNLLGGLLFLIGIILLALPGQGLLMMLMGILLMNFPGKHRIELQLVKRPRILKALNAIRKRYGRAPLEMPIAV